MAKQDTESFAPYCSPKPEVYSLCRGEFAELHAKLDKLDEAIRGVRLMYRLAA